MIGAMFIAGKFETHQCLVWCCIHCNFCSFQKSTIVLNRAAFLRDVFSFEFVASQPLQRCQISCVHKQVETTKKLRAVFIAW